MAAIRWYHTSVIYKKCTHLRWHVLQHSMRRSTGWERYSKNKNKRTRWWRVSSHRVSFQGCFPTQSQLGSGCPCTASPEPPPQRCQNCRLAGKEPQHAWHHGGDGLESYFLAESVEGLTFSRFSIFSSSKAISASILNSLSLKIPWYSSSDKFRRGIHLDSAMRTASGLEGFWLLAICHASTLLKALWPAYPSTEKTTRPGISRPPKSIQLAIIVQNRNSESKCTHQSSDHSAWDSTRYSTNIGAVLWGGLILQMKLDNIAPQPCQWKINGYTGIPEWLRVDVHQNVEPHANQWIPQDNECITGLGDLMTPAAPP